MKAAYSIFISLFILILITESADARKWNIKKDMNLDLKYSTAYDDNILKLSDRDIDQFKDNLLNWKTSPSTYDDLVQDLGLSLSFTSPKILNRKTRIYYTYSYKSFARNSYNDRSSHSIFVTQDLTRKFDLIGSYFFIPDRYLRDYYDRDSGAVYATSFDYHLGSIGMRFSPSRKWRLEARYEGFQVYYNSKFTEYDSEGWGIRLSGRYSLTDQIRINGDFHRRWSDNSGYDESSTLAAIDPDIDAEYGDGSYGEEWFEYGLTWTTPPVLIESWDLDISHRIRHRFYTSSLPFDEDSYHRGREHLHQLLSLSLSGKLFSGIEGGPEIAYDWRRTDSPLDKVPVVKDYDNFTFAFNLKYRLW